jgi:hypothetical protein
VDDSPIVGIHRLELDRPARDSDGVGDLTDSLAEFVVAHGSPVPDVDLYTVGIPVLGLKNPIQEKLQIFQRFTLMTDQGLTFGRKNLKLATGFGLDFLDIRDETEVTKHGI